ncbi:MAG: aminopeptidase [Prevotella sp.]|nr:aminopeptidase [Prevotella sp.]
MRTFLSTVFISIISMALLSCSRTQKVAVENGVSHALAIQRKATLSDIHYTLSFHIPAMRNDSVTGMATIDFNRKGQEDLQIDFQGTVTGDITVNGKSMAADHHDEHVVIPGDMLTDGKNSITIPFTCLDNALNRNEEYLYTLFVPDHARSAFPCFDQPDLKATYDLSLTLPKEWTAISNGALEKEDDLSLRSDSTALTHKTMMFRTSELLPTYLFSFTAGKFEEKTEQRDGRDITILYRETDPDKVAQLPIVFDQIALSLKWLEDYTGIPYPFQKYGCVVLPGYQFGGMEHPGCIQFRDATIFLGKDATPDEEFNRLQLLAHETSHMWFGDLVTMKWFDDVWTKEVYANFMADKIAREQFPQINYDLNFIKTHYIPALTTDRTDGTHPIQQALDNLNQAGLLYGNIIYHKAPIMMRKLEEKMGDDALRDGLRVYLKNYSYNNSTWDDLIQILDSVKPDADIIAFDREWVKGKGVKTVEWSLDKGLPNIDGTDYARYLLRDSNEVARYISLFEAQPSDPQKRLAFAMTLYENFLAHRATCEQVYDALWNLRDEKNEQVLSVCSSNMLTVLGYFPEKERFEKEKMLLQTAQDHPVASYRLSLWRWLTTSALSQEVNTKIKTMWEAQQLPFLNERNQMSMAYHLAMSFPEAWKEIIDKQRERLTSDDRRKEFDFVSRACTPDQEEQEKLFLSLLQAENRSVEPYAAGMLRLLNNYRREPFNNRFIRQGLDVLEEVQRTGDIFFPLDWCNALLGGHKSKEAKEEVEKFLKDHPDYPVSLKNKLLQAAYILLNRQ